MRGPLTQGRTLRIVSATLWVNQSRNGGAGRQGPGGVGPFFDENNERPGGGMTGLSRVAGKPRVVEKSRAAGESRPEGESRAATESSEGGGTRAAGEPTRMCRQFAVKMITRQLAVGGMSRGGWYDPIALGEWRGKPLSRWGIGESPSLSGRIAQASRFLCFAPACGGTRRVRGG